IVNARRRPSAIRVPRRVDSLRLMAAAPAKAVADALSRAGVTDVLTGETATSTFAADASLYRVEPLAVVRPRAVDEVAATLEACRLLGVSTTARGGGTSIAGNAIGSGVVLDFSRHLNRVLSVDPDSATAV